MTENSNNNERKYVCKIDLKYVTNFCHTPTRPHAKTYGQIVEAMLLSKPDNPTIPHADQNAH